MLLRRRGLGGTGYKPSCEGTSRRRPQVSYGPGNRLGLNQRPPSEDGALTAEVSRSLRTASASWQTYQDSNLGLVVWSHASWPLNDRSRCADED